MLEMVHNLQWGKKDEVVVDQVTQNAKVECTHPGNGENLLKVEERMMTETKGARL